MFDGIIDVASVFNDFPHYILKLF